VPVQYNATGAEAVVLARIKAETIRAVAKHGAGTMGINLSRDLVKILEELGEAAQASLDMERFDRTVPSSEGKPTAMKLKRLHFEDEMVQMVSLSLRVLITLQWAKEARHV